MVIFIKTFDWPLFIACFFIVAVGLVSLWSISPDRFFIRQVVWVAVGTILLFIFANIDYRIFKNQRFLLIATLLFGISLLVSLLIAAPKTRGVASWFWFGSIAFEPVEFIKLVIIIVLAKYFSHRHTDIYRIRYLVISSLYVLIPLVLVILQPDLGSAFILLAIWVSTIIFAGINIRHLAVILLSMLVFSVLGWHLMFAPYQKVRVLAFVNPYSDPQGTGYNAIQAMIAAGSGRIFGKGIGYGTQSHLNFLPEAETDFIFAAFAEETGFVGALIFLFLFGFFLWRVLKVGAGAGDNFSKLFALGFSTLVFMQLAVHVGANIGMLPITGITLPFVSYGGSSLVMLMVGVGILESIRIHSRSDLAETIDS